MPDQDEARRDDHDRTTKRVLLSLVALPVGWIVGVYLYVGLLHVFGDGPEPGDIHVGAVLLGLATAICLAVAAWRWSGRAAHE